MGKVSTRSDPLRYRLNERQKEKYNRKHNYLAPEIRNVFDTKTSTMTDIYSMGVVFDLVGDKVNLTLQNIVKPIMSAKPTDRPNSIQIYAFFQKCFKGRFFLFIQPNWHLDRDLVLVF